MDYLKWIEISESALVFNVKQFQKNLPKKSNFMAVIKSNAYGHGLLVVANILIKHGVKYFAVFDMSEAKQLRSLNKDIYILVLNKLNALEIDTAIKNNINVTITDFDILKEVLKHKNFKSLKINLKIDTGLSRQGFQMHQINTLVEVFKNNPTLNLETLYTHLVGAVYKKFDKITKDQFEKLIQYKKAFQKIGLFVKSHISPTTGTIINDYLSLDFTRVGIGLYGFLPKEEIPESKFFALKPVLTFKTIIQEIKYIQKGDTVGYNATFKAKEKTKIAILPVGYYDGIPRSLSNKGYVLCNGVKCKILGNVMMNMCVVDVSSIKNCKLGDEVVLLGKQKNSLISADEVGKLAGTIDYEILSRISPNITRIAVK